MTLPHCSFEGVITREAVKNQDPRGWLIELFRSDELASANLPVMAYVSMTAPGAVRGPHEHRHQTDLFACVGPSTFRIYMWDNRPDSPTRGQRFVFEAGEDHPLLFSIPPGIVHGYKNVGAVPGLIFNAPNRLYAGVGRGSEVDEIRYELSAHPEFKID